ncbi:MAG: transmembrane 220 family protein [Chromatiales bacterium]|nr:transmembrane 220 family protein [Chromatiales bacterium]
MSLPRRVLAAVFALVALAMALVQLNDPDPIEWVAIYLAGAVVSAAGALGWQSRRVTLVLLLVAAVWSAWLSPAVPRWLANHPLAFIGSEASVSIDYMERSRECLGLLILVVMLAAQLPRDRRPHSGNRLARR